MTPKDIVTLTTGSTALTLPPLAEIMKASYEDQMQYVALARQLSTVAQAAIGKVLFNLKSTVPHGEFAPLLEKHGWSPRTAQDYIRFAEFADLVANKNPSALSMLDMTRWTIVRRQLDDKALIDFVSGKEVCGLTLESAQEKEGRELKLAFEEHKRSTDVTIARHEKSIADLETKLDTAEEEKRQLREKLEKKRTDFVATFREESSAFAAEAALKIEAMEELLNELGDISATSRSKEHQNNCRIAGATLYQNARMLTARASQLLQQLHDSLPAEATEAEITGDLVFTQEEIDISLRNHRDMVAAHEQEIAIRETQREMNKPRKAGRPKKK